MSKYESTSYLCTLFDIQCCQSVIRKLVYGFMCRLDSSVNCIIKGILATSLRYTTRIRKHWCSLLYINSWQINLCFSHCVQLACNVGWYFFIINQHIIWTSDCYVLLVCILYCWVWNKAIELNWIDIWCVGADIVNIIRYRTGKQSWDEQCDFKVTNRVFFL